MFASILSSRCIKQQMCACGVPQQNHIIEEWKVMFERDTSFLILDDVYLSDNSTEDLFDDNIVENVLQFDIENPIRFCNHFLVFRPSFKRNTSLASS